MFELLDVLQTLPDRFTTTEARLAVTAGLALLAAIAAFGIAPIVVRRSVRFARRRFEASDAGTHLDTLDRLFDVPFPMRAVVRTIQTAIFVGTALCVLLVWGFVETVAFVGSLFVTAAPYLGRVLLTIGLLFGGILGTRYFERRLDDWLADANYVTDHQEGVVFRVLQICTFVAVALAALSVWDVNLGGLLIGAGFLGIVIGMASRQTLGSLVAGFVLMFSRPFEIGDWVQVGDHEGIVLDITIVNTRLRSFDGEVIVLPNDHVSGSTVVNRTRRQRLRLRVEVAVDYDADLERAEAVAREAIEGVEDVAPAPKPDVVPTAFADSAITLECRFWIQQPNVHTKWRTTRAVIHAVKDAYEREGIKIPFPQRELSGRAETGGFRIAPEEGRDAESEFTYADET